MRLHSALSLSADANFIRHASFAPWSDTALHASRDTLDNCRLQLPNIEASLIIWHSEKLPSRSAAARWHWSSHVVLFATVTFCGGIGTVWLVWLTGGCVGVTLLLII